jgi:hypothetical protein
METAAMPHAPIATIGQRDGCSKTERTASAQSRPCGVFRAIPNRQPNPSLDKEVKSLR